MTRRAACERSAQSAMARVQRRGHDRFRVSGREVGRQPSERASRAPRASLMPGRARVLVSRLVSTLGRWLRRT